MITTEKKDGGFDGPKLVITIDVSHQIVDDCFIYYRFNAASEGKRLIMEAAGQAYEEYVRTLANKDDTAYFDKEFGNVRVVNES